MIRYLQNKEIDFVKWDAAVERSVNGNFSAYSWFLSIVSKHWDALIEDDYEFIMPLPWKSKFGISYIFQPFFVNQLGVFSSQPVSQDRMNRFVEAIPMKFKLIESGLNKQNPVPEKKYSFEKKYCQYIDLSLPYIESENKYSDNVLRNIRKAKKNNLIICEDISPALPVEMFKNFRGIRLGHFTNGDFRMLLKLSEKMIRESKGFTTGTFDKNGKVFAAALFTKSHDCITYLKGGVNEEGKQTGAMHFLMDSVIKKYSDKNLIFDFGGSSVPNVARFNRGFSLSEYTYYIIRRNDLPAYLKWIKNSKDTLKGK